MNSYDAQRHTHTADPEPAAVTGLRDYLHNIANPPQRPADPLSPLTQLTDLAQFTTKGLSQFSGAEDLAQGDTTGVALGMLGAPGLVGTRIAKGALQAYPTLFQRSMFDDSLGYLGKKLKAVLSSLPGAAALSTVPAEAEAGFASEMITNAGDAILSLLRKPSGQKPTTVAEGIGQRVGRFNEAFGDAVPPALREPISILLQEGQHDPEALALAVKGILDGGS